MADIQTINVGNKVNDGLGDDLRTAFEKVNANFSSLNAELTVDVINLGDGGAPVFKEKVGSELRLRSIEGGTKVALTTTSEKIIVNNTAPDAFTRVDTDSGSVLADAYQQVTMQGIAAPLSETGTKDIEVTTSGSTINFKTLLPVSEYLTTYDFGSINGTYANAIQLSLQASNIDFGTITLESDLELDCGGLV